MRAIFLDTKKDFERVDGRRCAKGASEANGFLC